MSYLQEEYKIRRQVFCPTSRSIQESEGLFIWQATYKGNGSTGKTRKPLSPPGLVYCHKKRAWESWEKKRKRPRKARRWLQRRQRSVCPKPRIHFFLVHEYWGLEVARLGECNGSYKTSSTRKPCATAVPETDSLTQQKQYLKRTTLRTFKLPLQSIHSKECPHYRLSEVQESCHQTSNKYHMAWVRWKSHCKAFVARKARTIALEQSARKLS